MGRIVASVKIENPSDPGRLTCSAGAFPATDEPQNVARYLAHLPLG